MSAGRRRRQLYPQRAGPQGEGRAPIPACGPLPPHSTAHGETGHPHAHSISGKIFNILYQVKYLPAYFRFIVVYSYFCISGKINSYFPKMLWSKVAR